MPSQIYPVTILLIEDDEEDYILLKKILAKIPHANYKVLWKSSYTDGLTCMLKREHDLCMLDYRLGAQNGIELVKEARSQNYELPVILLTGIDENEIDIQAFQAGADDYISKGQLQGELLYRIIRYAIERRKAELEREKLVREQMANRELEARRNEFISMVTHELKTPLTSLKGYAQLLRKHYAQVGGEQALKLTTRMEVQINKLTDLIDDFQDVTRIEGGKLQFRESAFSFDELVEEVVEEVRPISERHTIIVVGATHKTIWGDRMRIGQVIINLLTNAIKYAPETERIVVKISANVCSVKLCVQDNGPGIPRDRQAKVFDPFYRMEKMGEGAPPGLGLGLYIAAEIIRRQDGRIWVESEEGQGATFCFVLPVDSRENGASPVLQNSLLSGEEVRP